MVYNGEPVDGNCSSSRGSHTGIKGSFFDFDSLNQQYLYGSSFTYDTSNNTFTLVGTFLGTISSSTQENYIGKFTCKDTTGTCSTLYSVSEIKTDSYYVSTYTVGLINRTVIGKSTFNNNYNSVSSVGYMYNRYYRGYETRPGTTPYIYGSDFTYDETNNTYTLSGNVQTYSGDWNTYYNVIYNTPYTCWNTTGTCTTISYINSPTGSNVAFYIQLDGGYSVYDAIEDMIWSEDVNRFNSTIKGVIDSWYAQNLTSYTSMLEDTVFCNDRNVVNLNNWNSNVNLNFSGGTLECSKVTDQFSTLNNKARLTYPVALLSKGEVSNITSSLRNTGYDYWLISPYYSNDLIMTYQSIISNTGTIGSSSTSEPLGIRPVISIKEGPVFSSGTGSVDDPWIIQE